MYVTPLSIDTRGSALLRKLPGWGRKERRDPLTQSTERPIHGRWARGDARITVRVMVTTYVRFATSTHRTVIVKLDCVRICTVATGRFEHEYLLYHVLLDGSPALLPSRMMEPILCEWERIQCIDVHWFPSATSRGLICFLFA
jgi:hypothetical protein